LSNIYQICNVAIFVKDLSNSTLYVKLEGNEFLLIFLYVDDLLVIKDYKVGFGVQKKRNDVGF